MQIKIKHNAGLVIKAHSFIGLAKMRVSLLLLEYVLYYQKGGTTKYCNIKCQIKYCINIKMLSFAIKLPPSLVGGVRSNEWKLLVIH
jgi:hypothetical protein